MMISFFVENIGTILVSLLLGIMVLMIIRRIIKDKKSGKYSCGGNCAECMSRCHADKSNPSLKP